MKTNNSNLHIFLQKCLMTLTNSSCLCVLNDLRSKAKSWFTVLKLIYLIHKCFSSFYCHLWYLISTCDIGNRHSDSRAFFTSFPIISANSTHYTCQSVSRDPPVNQHEIEENFVSDIANSQDMLESGQHCHRLQRGQAGPCDGGRVCRDRGGEGGGGAGHGAAVHPADCQAGGTQETPGNILANWHTQNLMSQK